MVSRVSPRVADPAVRTTLIERAAGIIATEGPSALTLRRVAEDAGTSTMAIYTHFGGMAELRRAVQGEGFVRLAAHLDAVASTGDPVADLTALGSAYFTNAVTNPNLYRVMFMDHPVGLDDDEVSAGTFLSLVAGVRRCVDAGRFAPADPVDLATQLWALTHGIVTLHLAGFLTLDEAIECLTNAALHMFAGFGTDRRAARRSVSRARAAVRR